MTTPTPASAPASTIRRTALIGGAVALGAAALWLNFGRGGARPPADALDAARSAAAEMATDDPAGDPSATPEAAPVPSPARPTPLGGR